MNSMNSIVMYAMPPDLETSQLLWTYTNKTIEHSECNFNIISGCGGTEYYVIPPNH